MSEETKEELKERLTGKQIDDLVDLQYRVTQNADSEDPFSGEFYKKTDDGEYNCIVCHK